MSDSKASDCESRSTHSQPTRTEPATRRRQLEQRIDRTLGRDFPEIIHRRTMPGTDGEDTANVADAVLRTWSRVLEARELAAFLGADAPAQSDAD